MAKWQQKYRVEWDATDGRNGGAQRTVSEVLMDMERFNGRAKAEDQGAVALILDLATTFERVSLLVLGLDFPRKILRVLCGGECSSKDVRRFRSRPLRLFCQGPSGVACFYALFLQDALSEVTNIFPSLKLRVFVDDITALVKGRNIDVAEMAKKR